MIRNNQILRIILGLGIAFTTSTTVSTAQLSEPESVQIEEIRRIEQSRSTKIIVTMGGLVVIGAELWWFMLSKEKAIKARLKGGFQEVNIAVDGGYSPNQIVVQAGHPVRLNFFRKDPNSCLEKVILSDFRQAADLHLNETTPVEFIPEEVGEYTFHCAMNMFRGSVLVQGKAKSTEGGQSVIVEDKDRDVTSSPREVSQTPIIQEGIQMITIVVDHGYNPELIILQKDVPVRLNFLRTDSTDCLGRVLLPDFELEADLPLNQTTSIEFTPHKSGKYQFTCGMKMFNGTLLIQDNEVSSNQFNSAA